MKKHFIMLLILLMTLSFCSSNNSKEDTTSTGSKQVEKDQVVKIIKTYSGMVTSQQSFGRINEKKIKREFCKKKVIKDEKAFKDFVSSIPSHYFSRMGKGAKNDDPLLKKPKIDFSKNMILVSILLGDVYNSLPITSVKKSSDKMHVEIKMYDKRRIGAQPINYSSYYAVVVPKFDGDIKFKIKYNLEPGKIKIKKKFQGISNIHASYISLGNGKSKEKEWYRFSPPIKMKFSFHDFIRYTVPDKIKDKKNDDPIKKETVDFKKEMVLTVFRRDSTSKYPDITSVDIDDNGTMVVSYKYPDEEKESKANVGSYCAVIVPTYNGKVIYKKL